MQLVQGQIGLTAGEANIMDYAVIPDPVNQHDKVGFYLAFQAPLNFVLKLAQWICFFWLVDLFHLPAFKNSRLDPKQIDSKLRGDY
jgi:hypothetical protein